MTEIDETAAQEAFVPTEHVVEAATTAADILDQAADLLTPDGAWIQGGYARTGSYRAEDLAKASCWCVAGAIGAVSGMDGPEAEEWANRVLGPLIPGLEEGYPMTGVPGWNDRPGRTQAEVVAALRQAAELARAK